MNKTQFTEAVDSLSKIGQELESGKISSFEYAHARETSLVSALVSMAALMGVTLQQPMQIDGNGEFSVVAMRPDGKNPNYYGCGEFGEAFLGCLNTASPRTGVLPGTLCASTGWCRVNHFEAEKMVKAYYGSLLGESR